MKNRRFLSESSALLAGKVYNPVSWIHTFMQKKQIGVNVCFLKKKMVKQLIQCLKKEQYVCQISDTQMSDVRFLR